MADKKNTPAAGKTRKPRTTAPKDETKAQKFYRLLSVRLEKTLVGLVNIGKMASPNYEYTDAQVAYLNSELQKAVNDVATKFATKGKAASVKVALPPAPIAAPAAPVPPS